MPSAILKTRSAALTIGQSLNKGTDPTNPIGPRDQANAKPPRSRRSYREWSSSRRFFLAVPLARVVFAQIECDANPHARPPLRVFEKRSEGASGRAAALLVPKTEISRATGPPGNLMMQVYILDINNVLAATARRAARVALLAGAVAHHREVLALRAHVARIALCNRADAAFGFDLLGVRLCGGGFGGCLVGEEGGHFAGGFDFRRLVGNLFAQVPQPAL